MTQPPRCAHSPPPYNPLLSPPPSSFIPPSLPPEPQAMQSRAAAHGVTRDVKWLRTGGEAPGAAKPQLLAFASGPIESASHVETSLMQLVQEMTVQAQVRLQGSVLGSPQDAP